MTAPPTPGPDNDELRAWLRLALTPGLPPESARLLLARFGLPQSAVSASASALRAVLPADQADRLRADPAAPVAQAIDDTLAWAAEPGCQVVTLADAAYPPSLLSLSDPPLLLYVRGHVDQLSRPALAMVGARSATAAGMDDAQAFAHHLATSGWCIVSGLAVGIDTAAHRGALLAGPTGGGTVAVVGTGIDRVYPARQHALARDIAQHGALVSELPLGTPPRPHQFPRRNRLVAALALGTLVVEAAPHSGSLITARLAAELGREVFAIPGSIHSPLARGCHQLIRQGAKLVESAQDILEELQPLQPATLRSAAPPTTGDGRPRPSRRPRIQTDEAEPPSLLSHAPGPGHRDDPVLAALGAGPASADTLILRTGLPAGELASRLAALELADQVERLPDGRVQPRRTPPASSTT